MTTERPNQNTLALWRNQWRAHKRTLYKQLMASYTPEQKELLRGISKASRQVTLCSDRFSWPDGRTTATRHIAWPTEPPQP